MTPAHCTPSPGSRRPRWTWIGVGVRDTAPPCGCGPFITTRQLRIVTHHGRKPWGPLAAIACPGGCREFAPVQDDGSIGRHGCPACPWTGIQVVEKGLYPPLLAAQDYR
ncbi:hypothetical protein [Nocardia sp. NPDC051750]|uniref:hypothetical protein n=1 Tax=Nocardia sp. NPDC051750 TaxID=3364325 RepID=UPI0037AA4782